MKNIPALLLIHLFCLPGMAQGVFRNQTSNTLEQVVQDYPSQFKNIKGELLSSVSGSAEYKSVVAIPGSVSTTITQATAAHKQVMSWQSVVFTATEFGRAKARFEELFNQIKNTIIKPEGEKAVIVNGLYTAPSEDGNATAIQFDLLPASGLMQQLNIELVMKNAGRQWKIVLSVYDKDRQATETMMAK